MSNPLPLASTMQQPWSPCHDWSPMITFPGMPHTEPQRWFAERQQKEYFKLHTIRFKNENVDWKERQWDLQLASIYICRYGCRVGDDCVLKLPYWIHERWCEPDRRWYHYCTVCNQWATTAHLLYSEDHAKRMWRIYVPPPPAYPPPPRTEPDQDQADEGVCVWL